MEVSAGLATNIRGCVLCPLQETRKNATPADVGPEYRVGGLAFMAGFPRALEDAAGKPLVSGSARYGIPAGVLFEQALGMAGLDRGDVLVLNRVRCKPPRNRIGDYPEATANCDQWNVAELEAYNPGVVVLLGGSTVSGVFGAKAKVTHLRGVFRSTGDEFPWGKRVWTATFDPSAAGHQPELLLEIVDDIKQAVEVWKGAQ